MLPDSTLLLNRYRIINLRDMGRENPVYHAYDESQGVDVAVKENAHRDPVHQHQFQLEAGILANLRYPNIPRGRDFFDAETSQFIVMDYIEGINLEQLMQQRRPGTEEILDWAVKLCNILAYLHSLTPPILHRDVEPSNIILMGNNRLFLVDFGFAKVHDTARVTAIPEPADEQMARRMPPLRTDRRSDQYSLAATLYALLTGAPPPDSMERLSGKPKLALIRPSRPDLSASAEAAIFRALSLDQNRRFSDMESFKLALRAEN